MFAVVRGMAALVAVLGTMAADRVRKPQPVTGWAPVRGDYEEQD